VVEAAIRGQASKLGDVMEFAADAYGASLTHDSFLAQRDAVMDVLRVLADEIDGISIDSA